MKPYHKCIFLGAIIFFSIGRAKAQRDTVLNQPNTTGTFIAPHTIELADGFSSSGDFAAIIDPSLAQCVAMNIHLSNSQNYIATYTPRVGTIINPADPNNTTCQVMATIQYFDGLGRPIQNVQVKASPTFRDVVQAIAYDQFGRETTKYLPYTSLTANDGSYKPAAIADQLSFYTNPVTSWNAPGVPKIPFPIIETAFEPSPLNRAIEEGSPGDNWQLTGKAGTTNAGHTVKTDYGTNDASSISSGTGRWAKLYSVALDANGKPTLVDNGAYGINQLYVTITKDENWQTSDGKNGTMEEYTDKQGQIILRRSFDAGNVFSTYFVYNDLGNLSYVLTPKAEPDNGSINQTTLDAICYQYRYDERNRMVEKKLPGQGAQYLVYNKLDLVVASQDSMQRANNLWMFTKFDALSRPIMLGTWNNGGSPISRLSLKTQIDALSSLWESRDNSNTAGQYYTQSTFPVSNIANFLTVTYYDDYNIPNLPSTYDAHASYSQMTKSLVTAKRINILGTSNLLWAVQYYDDKGRVVKTFEQHNLGGGTPDLSNYDEVATNYNFTGQTISTLRNHHTVTNPILAVRDSFVYDHVGRNVETWKKINGETNVLVAKVDYNELGQVKTKHLHSIDNGNSFLQDIAYTYNERGWVAKDSSRLFVMQLKYNDGTHPRYNGNIADQNWGTGSSLSKTYAYQYDKLNRLTSGVSNEGFTEQSITYDKAGNFNTLTRIDPRTSTTRNLSYTYSGNQLQTLGGMTTSGNYTYDGNGNAKFDALNNVNISYNILNLPQNITGSKTISYTYNADGKKMRRVSSNATFGNDDYINNIQYHNGAVDFILTSEGKARRNATDGTYHYEYSIDDHLGNTRVTFDDSSHVARVIQRDDYYPFGLNYNRYTFGQNNKYLFNNKELQEEIGQYDFGARFYDPQIARWLAYDPLAEKSRRWTPYAYGFNNPLFFTDPDGMDGIASISKAAGTKKDPIVVTITANYYYASATDVQKQVMADVKSDLASEKTVQGSDGTYYSVKVQVDFVESKDPTASAKADVGVNGGSYGNVLTIKNSNGSQAEAGDANDTNIEVFENKAKEVSDSFNEENQAPSYKAAFGNVLKEEVLHNLGGLHQDGGGVPPNTEYTSGHTSVTEKERPASKNYYNKNNANALRSRIGKPLGTDKKTDAKDAALRDQTGTVGKVTVDEKKKKEEKKAP